jgi:putative CRISPR-associated protein (TIGR02620 family)
MIYFISRHIGIINWAKPKGVTVDEQYVAFNQYVENKLTDKDLVIGTLTQAEIEKINAKGGHYVHFDVNTPKEKQGHSLSADELNEYHADFKYGVVNGKQRDYLTVLDQFRPF